MHRHLDDDALQIWAERGRLPAEAAACPQCRAQWEAYRQLLAALAALPRLSPSPGFADRVVEAWRATAARRPARPWAGLATVVRWVPGWFAAPRRTGAGGAPWWAWMALPLVAWALGGVALLGAVAAAPQLAIRALAAVARLGRNGAFAAELALEGLLRTLRDGPWGQAVAWFLARPAAQWLALGLTILLMGALGVATVVALGRRTLHEGWNHGAEAV